MTSAAAYDELMRRWRELSLLSGCEALLGWDELTYLPRRGVEHRSRQLALLAGMQHERATDPRLGELLHRAEVPDDPLSPREVNVREARRTYERLTRLPRTLVEELARVAALAERAWEAAREKASFAEFAPWLAQLVLLKQAEAQCLAQGGEAYDALLQEYEPGLTARALEPLFATVRRELTPLAAAIAGAGRQPDASLLSRTFPVERQRVLCELAAGAVGFDFQRGRLDTAVHPFSIGIGPDDCRITTRYDAHDFGAAFFATLHEVGHGLYEQGFDPTHAGTPMGEAPSIGLHEAQARLWENRVGRGRAFWTYLFPLARHLFPASLGDVALDAFYFALNRVQASTNRIRADEVTYDLHIAIRFELERALVTGSLVPRELPAAWDEAYRRLLGVTPANDLDGCLQDGHWASGLFGYFPTYTLGNIWAAQLADAAARDLGPLEGSFARGHFAAFLGWLRERVHRHGSRYDAARLIEVATGTPSDPGPFVRGLQRKYAELYHLGILS